VEEEKRRTLDESRFDMQTCGAIRGIKKILKAEGRKTGSSISKIEEPIGALDQKVLLFLCGDE